MSATTMNFQFSAHPGTSVLVLFQVALSAAFPQGEKGHVVYILSPENPMGSVSEVDLLRYPKLILIKSPGETWLPYKTWTTTKMKILPKQDKDFYPKLYVNENVTQLILEADADRNSMFSGLLNRNQFDHRAAVSLPPFSKTYVGVDATSPFVFVLQRTVFDLLRFFVFCCGAFLFLSAKRLSRNAIFYYGSGMSLAVLASVLLALMFVLKRVRRPAFLDYAFWIFGPVWALTLWRGWHNILWICQLYPVVVAGYVMASALLAFAILYRSGPPDNPRTLQLFQWAIQFVGLALVAGSTSHPPTALGLCFLLALLPWTGEFWRQKLRILRYRYFPPTRRLLTLEEYDEVGRVETERALRELRSFVASPECSPWQTVNRLSDPRRMARFVDGGIGDVTAEEELEHGLAGSRLPLRPDFSDDDDDDSSSGEDGTRSPPIRTTTTRPGSSSAPRASIPSARNGHLPSKSSAPRGLLNQTFGGTHIIYDLPPPSSANRTSRGNRVPYHYSPDMGEDRTARSASSASGRVGRTGASDWSNRQQRTRADWSNRQQLTTRADWSNVQPERSPLFDRRQSREIITTSYNPGGNSPSSPEGRTDVRSSIRRQIGFDSRDHDNENMSPREQRLLGPGIDFSSSEDLRNGDVPSNYNRRPASDYVGGRTLSPRTSRDLDDAQVTQGRGTLASRRRTTPPRSSHFEGSYR